MNTKLVNSSQTFLGYPGVCIPVLLDSIKLTILTINIGYIQAIR